MSKPEQGGSEGLHFDLQNEGQALLQEARQAAAGRAATTLVKDGPLRLTLLAVMEGVEIKEHKVAGTVSIQVVTGEVDITAGGQAKHLGEDEALLLGANVVHAVQARSDAVILLTIAMAQG